MGKPNPLFSKTTLTLEKMYLLPTENASKQMSKHCLKNSYSMWKVTATAYGKCSDRTNSSDRMWRTTSTAL